MLGRSDIGMFSWYPRLPLPPAALLFPDIVIDGLPFDVLSAMLATAPFVGNPNDPVLVFQLVVLFQYVEPYRGLCSAGDTASDAFSEIGLPKSVLGLAERLL